MKLKAKIVSTMMSMILALGVMGFAVWAAATQTLVVNNTVSFVSDHVLASIKGTVTGAVGENLDAEYFGEVDESTSASNKFEAWDIGDIEFGNELVPIEIELKITNKSLQRFFTFEIDFVNDVIASDNVVRSVTYDATSNDVVAEGATYTEGSKVRVDKNTVATVVVTLNIADTGKSVDAFRNDFSVTLLNLGVESEQPGGNEGFIFDGNAKSVTIPKGQELRYDNLPDMSAVQGDTLYGFYKSYDETTETYSNRVTLPYTAEETNEVLFAKFGTLSESLLVTLNESETAYEVAAVNASTILGDVVIPALYNSLPITSVAKNGFQYASNLTSITLPETISIIDNYAFANATNMQNVNIPNSVLTIGEGAFYDCSLLNVNLSDNLSIEYIDRWAFSGTPFDNSLPLNQMVYLGKVAYQYKTVEGYIPANTEVVINPGTTSIYYCLFYWNNWLTSIEIPASVSSIGAFAFNSCYSLTSINLHEDSVLTEIPEAVFSGVPISSFTIPSMVTKIDESAFEGSSITSIVIPASVTTIGELAFYNCAELTSLTFEEGSMLETIAYGAFMESGITSMSIPKHVSFIDEDIFYETNILSISVDSENLYYTVENQILYNLAKDTLLVAAKSITSASIPNTVTTMQYGAFQNCTLLESVVFETSSLLTDLPTKAFENCSALESISFQNGLTNIGVSAFENCVSLTELNIPNSVTTISDNAFKNCTALAELNIPSGVTTIGMSAFENCTALTDIVIPETVTYVGYGVLVGATALINITVPLKSSFNRYDHSYVRYYFGASNYGGGTIPTSLRTVSVQPGITAVGNYAFYNLGTVTNITLPNGIQSVGMDAFRNCTSLSSIVIPSSVTNINSNAFYNCPSLSTVYIGSVTVANNLTTQNAQGYLINFATTIYLQEGISTIGAYVTNNFTNVEPVQFGGLNYAMHTKN